MGIGFKNCFNLFVYVFVHVVIKEKFVMVPLLKVVNKNVIPNYKNCRSSK